MLLALAFGKEETRIPRQTLQTLLWKPHNDKALRHRLSQLVYQTNQTADTRVFEPDGEHIVVNRGTVTCDVDEYSALVSSGEFRQAWEVFERGFLSACHHRKTPPFADWIEEQRLAKRSELRRAALTAWEMADASHQWSAAKRASEILLRLDPHEEAILRRVMRARVFAGEVREAEAVYRAFADRVDPSGQWTPEPATKTLLQNVRNLRQDPIDRPASAKSRSPTPRSSAGRTSLRS